MALDLLVRPHNPEVQSPVSDQDILTFKAYLERKNSSPHTIRNYLADLNQFFTFLEFKEMYSTAASDVKTRDIRAFLGFLHGKGLKKSTLARKLESLRSFFNFLERQGLLKNNPAKSIQAIRPGRSLPRVLSIEEAVHLVQVPTTGPQSDHSLRDRAILETFYSTGMRSEELVRLNIEDLDPKERLIKILGKGMKERIVPIGPPAIEAIKKYRDELKEPRNLKSPLFINRFGKRLTTRSVYRIVIGYSSQSGMTVVSPIGLRHSFATHMLDSGADLKSIQEFMGHSRIETTEMYTHLSLEKLIDVHRQAHPRAKK